MRSKASAAFAALMMSLASPAGAAPGEPIGSAVKIVNLVTAEYNRDTRSLQSGDGVNQDELVIVGSDAQGELKFKDETKLALGAGARVKLDKFIFDPDKSSGSIVMELVKGSFRFITGVAQKPAYVIRTPTASITVRGTIFDVFVQEKGLTWLLLHEGAVKACNARGECRDIDEPGKLIRIDENGDVGKPVRWAGLTGNDLVPFDTAFPFVVSPPSIDPNPALNRDAILTDEPKKRTEDEDSPKRSKRSTEPKKTSKEPVTKKAETPPPKKIKKTRTAGDENVKQMTGIGIAIGVGIGMGGGYKGGGNKGGGHGGTHMKGDGGHMKKSY